MSVGLIARCADLGQVCGSWPLGHLTSPL